MKVQVHDGVGIWMAARRLNQGKFHWRGIHRGAEVQLDSEQLQKLVLGSVQVAQLHCYKTWLLAVTGGPLW